MTVTMERHSHFRAPLFSPSDSLSAHRALHEQYLNSDQFARCSTPPSLRSLAFDTLACFVSPPLAAPVGVIVVRHDLGTVLDHFLARVLLCYGLCAFEELSAGIASRWLRSPATSSTFAFVNTTRDSDQMSRLLPGQSGCQLNSLSPPRHDDKELSYFVRLWPGCFMSSVASCWSQGAE